mmetsp:Transcript_15931/g.17673  ORF Transcript_15931/g.17673 Transcript_15931/m.17673 type:complete len:81 (-) Transcript_15931:2-244(-)
MFIWCQGYQWSGVLISFFYLFTFPFGLVTYFISFIVMKKMGLKDKDYKVRKLDTKLNETKSMCTIETFEDELLDKPYESK